MNGIAGAVGLLGGLILLVFRDIHGEAIRAGVCVALLFYNGPRTA
jgi:hypothetical protein